MATNGGKYGNWHEGQRSEARGPVIQRVEARPGEEGGGDGGVTQGGRCMLTEPKEDVGVGACVGIGVGIDIGIDATIIIAVVIGQRLMQRRPG